MLNQKALAASVSAGPKTYVEDVFSTWLYEGTGTTQTITNGIDLSGKGGLVWIKRRSGTTGHRFTDTARGATKSLESNSSAVQATESTGLTAFNADGFSLGADADYSTFAATYASWTFRKQEKFFDVVTYTGTDVPRTINHNLGSVPGCIIVKRTDAVSDWQVYHRSLANTEYMVLNSTAAKATGTTHWNSTTPTSTVFSLGNALTVNALNGSYVAYLFAHDAGGFGDSGNDSVIKCGSYTGNGSSSGPTIDLGWEPQWLMLKRTSGAGGWYIYDNMRGIRTTGVDSNLVANSTGAEDSSFNYLDLTSTGFKLTTTSNDHNGSGDTYIYIAIRRGPMKTPTDATKVYQGAISGTNNTPAFTTNFPPDLFFAKSAQAASIWQVVDRVRGLKELYFNEIDAETGSSQELYQNGAFASIWLNYYGWGFRRAPGFFDVVAYTGDGTTNRLISHNLGVKPELIITKNRDGAPTVTNWMVSALAADLDFGGTTFTYVARLNTTDAFFSNNAYFTSTAPTTTGFYVTTQRNNTSVNFITYLFASCNGVSKVGTYTGVGTGTTLSIDCGFTNGARFVMIKRRDSLGDWYVWDTARGIVSGNDPYLLLNSTAAEVTNTDYIDPLSSGFQISSTAPAAINANGGTFIYLAIA